MKRRVLYSLDTPYREVMDVVGFDFGNEDAEPTLAIVGAMRGNEVQQMYTCAHLVRTLERLEKDGYLDPTKKIRVIPSVNHFSMNVGKRFWAMDGTDINRMMPGYDQGETTQRIAAGVFEAVKGFKYGIQLCSFYLPGDFRSHVRVTDASMPQTEEALELASSFEFPYVLFREPSPFDTTTLNYNWQVWETTAFSIYARETDNIDTDSRKFMERAILRFMKHVGISTKGVIRGYVSEYIDEASLANVVATKGGMLIRKVELGEPVNKGKVIGEIINPLNAAVVEHIVAPCDGSIFFCHKSPLVYEHTAVFRIAPLEDDYV